MRHRSPKSQNYYGNHFFHSPQKKQVNIINFDNQGNSLNNNNQNNNQLNFHYNRNNYNYYDEITKAFNFITFVLKQKDKQIQELKIKINDLQKQLNEINETNMMTFNNQEIMNSSSNASNFKFVKNDQKGITTNKKQNNLNLMSPNFLNNKVKISSNNIWNIQTEISNNNSINASTNNSNINIYKNSNIGNEPNINNINNKINFDNKINFIHKIKNSTNINKINNYRNVTDVVKNNNNFNSDNNYLNEMPNKPINININEHSTDKNYVNQIRKESYHSNLNVNLRNKNDNIKQVKNFEQKNFTTDSEKLGEKDKVKILNINNLERPGSKSNSFNLSDDGNMINSKKDIKNYLKEVKNKLEPEKFKIFIKQIKELTKKKGVGQKNIIISEIKNILGDKNLICKFENIMKVNKN